MKAHIRWCFKHMCFCYCLMSESRYSSFWRSRHTVLMFYQCWNSHQYPLKGMHSRCQRRNIPPATLSSTILSYPLLYDKDDALLAAYNRASVGTKHSCNQFLIQKDLKLCFYCARTTQRPRQHSRQDYRNGKDAA